MKPGEPLRRTELKRTTPLKQTDSLRRTSPLQRSALSASPSARKSAPRRRDTGPSQDVVDAVYERASFCCEVCAAHVGPRRGVDHHIHHRRPRQMGGTSKPDTNMPQNLLLLDPSCHERIESEREAALQGGWLLKERWEPLAVPVLIHGRRLVYLTSTGEYVDVPAGDAA